MVRGGYLTVAEIIEIMAQRKDARPSIAELSKVVEAQMAERRSQLAALGSSTYARLDSALDQLEESGILARENFWCCQTCAYTAMHEEVLESIDAGEDVRGFVLFHSQDTERVVETGRLLLRYGGLGENLRIDQSVSKVVGDEIVAVLRAADFEPEWSGLTTDLIELPIAWDKRPPEDVVAPLTPAKRTAKESLH